MSKQYSEVNNALTFSSVFDQLNCKSHQTDGSPLWLLAILTFDLI